MKKVKIAKPSYERILAEKIQFFVGKDGDCEPGDTIRFEFVDTYTSVGTISRESYVVTGKTNWTEEDTLRYGKCIYGVKKLGVILFPGDRTTLSNRSSNFLVRNSISDEDLVKMDYTDLLRMRGCGKKTAYEIMQYRGTLLKKNLFN